MGDWRKKMRWNWPWPGKGGKTQSSTASANRTTTMGGGIDSILPQQMASLYTEHFLSAEQLADLFPLARIEAGNLLASSGICPEEAALRLAERRRLHRRAIFSPRTLARRLLRPLCGQFLHCFRLLLLLGSLLCLAFWFLPFQQPQNGQLGLALFFFLTFLVTSLVAAVANWRAKKQLCRLTMPTKMDWPTVATFTTIRSGQQVSVRARDILPGELLLLGAGQPVAADLRVLKVLDGPLLAHSPWPISQQCPAMELEFTDKVASAKSMDVFQARNVLFAGSICTGGAALVVAIRTGEQTLLARLSAASKKSGENAQEAKWLPLRRDCLRLIQLGLCLSLGFSLVAFPAAFLFAPDASPSSAFVNVFLLLFLANLPHGLPLGLDVQLWLIGRRLRQNCGGLAFKRPEMADSLGRTSVLMVQHPAVLTANRPVLTDLWLAGDNRTLAAADIIDWTIRQRQEANGVVGSAKVAEKFGNPTLALLEAAAHCCRKVGGGQRQFLPQPSGVKSQRLLASFRKSVNKGKGSKRKGAKVADCSVPIPRKMPASIGRLSLPPELAQCPSFYAGGDPVDAAFSKFFGQLFQEDGSLKAGKELLQIDDEQEEGPLSWRTLRLALVRCSATGQCQLLARGAPEQLLADCTTIRGPNGDQVPMTEEHLVPFEEQFLRFSALGKRCVAVAVQENYSKEEEEQGEMPTTPSVLASDCSSAPPSSSFDLDADSPTPGEGWCFLGMLALSDQPKANAAENVRALESAGTRLVLISDEHPALAHAVAKRCGLLGQLGEGKGDDPEKPPPSPPLNGLKPSWRHRVRSPFARGQKKRHSVGSSSGYHSTELATGRPSEAGSEKSAHPEDPTQQQLQEWPIDGDSFSLMSGQRLDRLLGGDAGGPLLFSRLDSEQTGHLVKRFQALGHSVTFVGQSGGAQAGQAMEAAADVTIVGADSSSAPNPWLASQPGDAVCADPNLANIAQAIHEARALRHNMASILSFCLSQSPALFLSILMPILFGFPPALSQFQVLATALLAGIPCCLGLAFHQPSPPPQNHPNASSPTKLRPLLLHTFLFSGPLLAIGSLLAYLAVFWQAGLGVGDLFNSASTYWLPTSPNMTTTFGLLLPPDQQIAICGQAAAAWHLTLVAAQQIHVWLCAARGNAIAAGAGSLLAALRTRVLWLVVGFNFCCLLALLYLPALLSDSQPPAAQTWFFPVGIGVALFLANMLQALAIRRRNGKGPAEKVVDQK